MESQYFILFIGLRLKLFIRYYPGLGFLVNLYNHSMQTFYVSGVIDFMNTTLICSEGQISKTIFYQPGDITKPIMSIGKLLLAK